MNALAWMIIAPLLLGAIGIAVVCVRGFWSDWQQMKYCRVHHVRRPQDPTKPPVLPMTCSACDGPVYDGVSADYRGDRP